MVNFDNFLGYNKRKKKFKTEYQKIFKFKINARTFAAS